MSTQVRLTGFIMRALPVVVIAALVVLLVTGDRDPYRDLIELAEFTDVDENGDLAVMEFGTQVPDPSELAAIQTISRLAIENASLTKELTGAIAGRQQLRGLSLAGCTISDEALMNLDGLVALRDLDLSRTNGFSKNFTALDLPELRFLRLEECDWVDGDLLRKLSAFPTLESLVISGTNVSSDDLRALGSSSQLRWLECTDCPNIDDSLFLVLAELPRVQSVKMSGTNLTVAVVKEFQRQHPSILLYIPLSDFAELKPILERDDVEYGRAAVLTSELNDLSIVDDTGVDYSPLVHFSELNSLGLSGAGITDNRIEFLPQMTQLRFLSLSGSRVTDDGLKSIAALTNLRGLDLSETSVSDEGMRHLTGLSGLTWLDLSDTQISDAGLETLRPLRNLEYFDLRGIPLSDRGIAALREFQNLTGRLDLSGSKGGLADLSNLKGKPFQHVILAGHSPSIADMHVIATWTELVTLDLTGTGITGELLDLSGVQGPAGTGMNELILAHTRVTDETLPKIRMPVALQKLSLAHASVSGATLPGLSDLNLYELDLSYTPLSKRGVRNAFELKARNLVLFGVDNDVDIPEISAADDDVFGLSLDADTTLFTRFAESSWAGKLSRLTLRHAKSSDLARLRTCRRISQLDLIDSSFDAGSFVHLKPLSRLFELRLIDCTVSAAAREEIGPLEQLNTLRVKCEPAEFQAYAGLTRVNGRLDVERIEPGEN